VAAVVVTVVAAVLAKSQVPEAKLAARKQVVVAVEPPVAVVAMVTVVAVVAVVVVVAVAASVAAVAS